MDEALTCGTHFGLTKLPASISRIPERASLFISSAFIEGEMGRGSFCRPSRGPTSTILTELEEANRRGG